MKQVGFLFAALLAAPSALAAVPDLTFTIALSEPVVVTGCPATCPRIALNVGGVTRYATFSAGSGTSSLTFTYSPVAGDLDLDGITISSTSIDLNTSGTIKDLNGNDLSPLTFTPPNTTGLKVNYPSLSMDFINGRYTLNDTSTTNFATFLTSTSGTFTRASTATYFDASGVLQTASANTPRLDYDPNSLAFKGLLLEEGRTNSIPNSQASGATLGVIGSGGSLPTGWSIGTGLPATLTREVVATGTLPNGMNYIDIRVYGSNSSGGVVYPDMYLVAGGSCPAATTGQSWTASAYIAIVAGSVTGFTSNTINFSSAGYTSAGSYLESAGSTPISSSSLTRYSATRTMSNASTARACTYVDFSVADGASVDVTLRIAAPQLELGSFATSYIPTSGAAATRQAEILTFPLGSWFTSSEGALFASYSSSTPAGVSTRAISLNNANISNVFQIANSASTVLFAQKIVASAIANSSGPTYVPGTIYRTAAAYDASSGPLAVNGVIYNNSNAGLPVGLSRLDIGNQNTINLLGGWIRTAGYYPLRASNAQLQLLTQ